MITLLSTQLCPDADFTQELGGKLDRDTWAVETKRPQPDTKRLSRHCSPSNKLTTTATPTSGTVPASVDPDELVPSDDELGHTTLTEGLKRLAVEPLDRRFHGKSSGVMLVQAAMNLKKVVMGADQPDHLLVPPTRRMEFWLPRPVSCVISFGVSVSGYTASICWRVTSVTAYMRRSFSWLLFVICFLGEGMLT